MRRMRCSWWREGKSRSKPAAVQQAPLHAGPGLRLDPDPCTLTHTAAMWQGGSVARYTVLQGEDPVEALLSLIRQDNNLEPGVEFGQYQGGFMDRWALPRLPSSPSGALRPLAQGVGVRGAGPPGV